MAMLCAHGLCGSLCRGAAGHLKPHSCCSGYSKGGTLPLSLPGFLSGDRDTQVRSCLFILIRVGEILKLAVHRTAHF